MKTIETATVLHHDPEIKKTKEQFQQDIMLGLTSPEKHLNSKYFYDAKGDQIFKKIMACEEYYPTSCEMEIFSKQTDQLAQAIVGDGSAFDLIELGAGDAAKTIYLLKQLKKTKKKFTYIPIDISSSMINHLNRTLPLTIPGLDFLGLNGEYLEMMQYAMGLSNRRKVVLFLGSNIGNMSVESVNTFCKSLRSVMRTGDMFMVGADLKKHPKTILAAYNDKGGLTREFNLNLLTRINRELDADFDLSAFEHYASYDPSTGACKSYLVSLKSQQVIIGESIINFHNEECIHMEISQKYTADQTRVLANDNHFMAIADFFDSRSYFLDTLWMAY